MKRREFLINSSLSGMGLGFLGSSAASGHGSRRGSPSGNSWLVDQRPRERAKNIIFLVSDGMSTGTLQMADLFACLKFNRHSHWMQYYLDKKVSRGLMDTASADSYVTDSAAASSAWGGGFRVKNGRLNVGSNNRVYKPIFQKFQQSGKGVGCVTTVPITHATPAGFCVHNKSRGEQAEIAELYLELKFNVMLGGGSEFFHSKKREDQRDMFAEFAQAGYHVAQSKKELAKIAFDDKPVLGVFHESGLPFSIDQAADATLQVKVPTLAEMTHFAIDRMQNLPEGFVLQVEGGKVDWAAHANDAPALLHDQIAFDEALKVAMDFAQADGQTLVIITTDHGNANPGLIGTSDSLEKFARTLSFQRSHSWIMQGLRPETTPAEIVDRVAQAVGFPIELNEAELLYNHLAGLDDKEIFNEYKRPYPLLASILRKYTSIGWAGTDHSGDYVELAMYGPGSELLPPFVKNTELHNFMLKVTETVEELVTQSS